MMRSLFAGVSGLKNHQTRMDVIGNNIANVNTVGFKSGRVTFQDMLSQTLQGASSAQGNRGGTNPMQIGMGMGLASIDTIFTDGSFQPTGKQTDLAISGQGFFVLSDGLNQVFTRAGAFDFDTEGNFLVPGTGYKVMGWSADANGVINSKQEAQSIQIPVGSAMPAQVTKKLSYINNLSASANALGPTSAATAAAPLATAATATAVGTAATLLATATTAANNATTAKNTAKAVYDAAAADLVTANGAIVAGDAALLTSVNTAYTLLSATAKASVNAKAALAYDPTNTDFIANDAAATAALVAGDAAAIATYNTTYTALTATAKAVIDTTAAVASTNASLAKATTLDTAATAAKAAAVAAHDAAVVADTAAIAAQAAVTAAYGTTPATGTPEDAVALTKTAATAAKQAAAAAQTAVTAAQTAVTAGAVAALNTDAAAAKVNADLAATATSTAATTAAAANDRTSDVPTSINVYDSQGNAYKLNGTFEKSADNTWSFTPASTVVDSNGLVVANVSSSVPVVVSFNADGTFASASSATFTIDPTGLTPPSPYSGAGAFTVTPDFSTMTQYGGESTALASGQDGYAAGTLSTVSIDPTGTIVGRFTNGKSQNLAQVALAVFNNPAGLNKVGESMFVKSTNSGDPQIGTSDTGGRGKFSPGSLEMSNVDLAQEFSNMIITQRGFQANSKIITTSDEMLEQLANLKR